MVLCALSRTIALCAARHVDSTWSWLQAGRPTVRACVGLGFAASKIAWRMLQNRKRATGAVGKSESMSRLQLSFSKRQELAHLLPMAIIKTSCFEYLSIRHQACSWPLNGCTLHSKGRTVMLSTLDGFHYFTCTLESSRQLNRLFPFVRKFHAIGMNLRYTPAEKVKCKAWSGRNLLWISIFPIMPSSPSVGRRASAARSRTHHAGRLKPVVLRRPMGVCPSIACVFRSLASSTVMLSHHHLFASTPDSNDDNLHDDTRVGSDTGPQLSSLLADGAGDGRALHLTLGVDDLHFICQHFCIHHLGQPSPPV